MYIITRLLSFTQGANDVKIQEALQNCRIICIPKSKRKVRLRRAKKKNNGRKQKMPDSPDRGIDSLSSELKVCSWPGVQCLFTP